MKRTKSDIQTFKILGIMFITSESMQVLKAGKATVSGSYKVGQVVTFKCGDGSTQKAKCTHAYQLNQYMPVGEFKPLVAAKILKAQKAQQDQEKLVLTIAELAGKSTKPELYDYILELWDKSGIRYNKAVMAKILYNLLPGKAKSEFVELANPTRELRKHLGIAY